MDWAQESLSHGVGVEVRGELTAVDCRCCLNSSMVVLEMLMSRNMPSSLEVNWQPHSVCPPGAQQNTAIRHSHNHLTTSAHTIVI